MLSPSERVLLFIPIYNCGPQIQRVIAQLKPEICALLSEVIVVDNRSTDGGNTAAIAALKNIPNLAAKVLNNDANYGLGGSHKVAFDYAIANKFDFCIVLHGDDQGDIDNIVPLIRAGAHRQVDCLLGARFMPGSRLEGYSWFRTFGNRVFNLLYSVASGVRIYDLGSGLNLYAVRTLADRTYLRNADDLTFNYGMILHSIAAGWRMRFFPIAWREDDQVSNVKIVRQSLRVLGIVRDYAFDRRRFLERDYSRQPGRAYTSTAVFANTPVAEAAS